LGEKIAPKGVSIRLPPANGFEGSAVWQLAQSAASAIALPRAMVSAEGSARAQSTTDAVHKSTLARIVSPMRLGRCTDLPPSALLYRETQVAAASRRFASVGHGDTTGNPGWAVPA
jgi:hypothetical protein